MLTWGQIEDAFERLLELVRGDARVRAEFERSRGDFYVDAEASRAPGAERRHLEWFLLERPCAALGGIPAQAWQDDWRGGLREASADLGASLLQSLPGAFEITSLAPGEVLWVRDLFTQGEHPIAEAAATSAMAAGDLLVGRLFPAGGGAFLLSPAVSVYRNPTLLEAVRIDLAEMRRVRRGVLRVQQLELERLFHGPGSAAAVQPAPEEARARARVQLAELGLAPEVVDGVLARVRRGARAGDGRVVTEILNDLAFDTGIDLAAARLLLVDLWESERGERDSAEVAADTARTRSALAAFDLGRAQGEDLEQLFRQLEHDLGIEDEEEPGEEEEPGAPDFPGVVGAMVEEFLWEVGLEQGPQRAREWAVLRELGNYGRDIGVLDDLGPTRLLDFSARWVLDESGLTRAGDVETLLDALAAFCRWCEERHDLLLWKGGAEVLALLRVSVPRHLELRQHSSAGPGRGAYRVVRVAPDHADLRAVDGGEATVALTPFQAANLRDGDLVRLARAHGEPVLGASYPTELADTLG